MLPLTALCVAYSTGTTHRLSPGSESHSKVQLRTYRASSADYFRNERIGPSYRVCPMYAYTEIPTRAKMASLSTTNPCRQRLERYRRRFEARDAARWTGAIIATAMLEKIVPTDLGLVKYGTSLDGSA